MQYTRYGMFGGQKDRQYVERVYGGGVEGRQVSRLGVESVFSWCVVIIMSFTLSGVAVAFAVVCGVAETYLGSVVAGEWCVALAEVNAYSVVFATTSVLVASLSLPFVWSGAVAPWMTVVSRFVMIVVFVMACKDVGVAVAVGVLNSACVCVSARWRFMHYAQWFCVVACAAVCCMFSVSVMVVPVSLWCAVGLLGRVGTDVGGVVNQWRYKFVGDAGRKVQKGKYVRMAEKVIPLSYGNVPDACVRSVLLRSEQVADIQGFRRWALLGDSAAHMAVVRQGVARGESVASINTTLSSRLTRETFGRVLKKHPDVCAGLHEAQGLLSGVVCAETVEALIGIAYAYGYDYGQDATWFTTFYTCLENCYSQVKEG